MSKLTDQLETIGVFNPHLLVNEGHPFIWLRRRGPGRTGAWMLTVSGTKFDAPWYDCGSLAFTSFGTRYNTLKDAVALPIAKCRELFPDLEMVKGPWPNTYVPKGDLDAAMKKLKEKKQ